LPNRTWTMLNVIMVNLTSIREQIDEFDSVRQEGKNGIFEIFDKPCGC